MLEGLYFFKNHFHVLNLTISCQTLHVTVQVPAKLCQFKRCIVGMVKQLEQKKENLAFPLKNCRVRGIGQVM